MPPLRDEHAPLSSVRVEAADLAHWIRRRAVSQDRFLFGLAGAPGSGKSTLAAQLASALDAVVVPMDGFHLPNRVLDERGLRSVKGAPQTFAAAEFVDAVRRLRVGEHDVALPAFDRELDEPVADRVVVPAAQRVVIVEGNYLLQQTEPWVQLAALFDATGHIEVDRDRRVSRLVARHVAFGKSPTEAAAFVEQSDEVNARLVEAAAHRADVRVVVS